jgi:hypothetical protein
MGNLSGQLDVVIEHPFAPSFPMPGGSQRLYPAEAVAAVIEVKSNLSSQWPEVLGTSERLAPLQRNLGLTTQLLRTGLRIGPDRGRSAQIPLFAVGYTGWKTIETVLEHLKEGPVTGILVLDEGLFAIKPPQGTGTATGPVTLTGPGSLWGLATALFRETVTLLSATPDLDVYVTGTPAGPLGNWALGAASSEAEMIEELRRLEDESHP